MFDDDFKSLTGGQADLNADGKVDLSEYMNDCDDFNRIYGKNSKNGKYNPKPQNKQIKLSLGLRIAIWILTLLGCLAPVFYALLNNDSQNLKIAVIITAVLLAAWIFAFFNTAKK